MYYLHLLCFKFNTPTAIGENNVYLVYTNAAYIYYIYKHNIYSSCIPKLLMK